MKHMPSPFFTVVIPTHDRAPLLREAIHSVLAQTFKDFELIVIDDHSTNDTQCLVTSIGDPRIKYVVNDHAGGGAGARNAGIFRASGSWTAFLDDDDVWLPNKLRLIHDKILEVDSKTGMIYSQSARYDFANNVELLSLSMPIKEGWIQRDLLYRNYVGSYSRVVIRTDILREVGGLDERFQAMQDMELYVRVAGLSKVACVREKLVLIRCANMDRITLHPKRRLASKLLFSEKYQHLIRQTRWLEDKIACRVFLFAVASGSVLEALKAAPRAIAFFMHAPRSLIHTLRELFFFVCKGKA